MKFKIQVLKFFQREIKIIFQYFLKIYKHLMDAVYKQEYSESFESIPENLLPSSIQQNRLQLF